MGNSGRMSTHDDAQDGRLSITVSAEAIYIVHTLLDEDQHYILDNLHYKIATQYKYVSYFQTSIHTILIEHLEMRKVRVCWVPCKLLEMHRNSGKVVALNFLTQYESEGDLFLHTMITGMRCGSIIGRLR